MIKVLFPGLLDAPVVQLELLLVLASLALGIGRFRLVVIDHYFRRFSGHPRAAFALCVVLALALHLAVAPGMTRHAPEVHDEFSYLLSADTFLHGSIVNPPHPLWRSFETAHVLFWPHYASMYPPAQGLMLAGGKLLFGDYLAGPWLASALLAGLAGWMLAAWVPRRWAVFGAFLVALRFSVFSYWGNSYWGGAIPAIGGLLLFGGVPRILHKARPRDATLMAIGLIMMAASRPFDGILALVSAGFSCLAVRRRHFWGWRLSLPSLATASIILAAGLASLLYYNWRVTGNPLVSGYNVSMQQYGWAVFPWQSTIASNPPLNRNLAALYESQHEWFLSHRTPMGFIASRCVAFGRFWAFYLSPLFTLPLLVTPVLAYSKRWRWILIAGVFYAVGLGLNPWFFPHYAAPAMGLLLLALIQAARIASIAKAGNKRPFALTVRAIPVVCVAVFAFRATMPLLGLQLPNSTFEMSWFSTPAGNEERAAVQARLEHEPGRHLVLVRYEPDHLASIEWVYNAARIDEAKVIWAHDLDTATNARLLAYYAGRRVWHLDADAKPPRPAEEDGRR